MARTSLSFADVISVAAAFVAVGGAAVAIYRSGLRLYMRTAGSRRDLTRRLNQLAVGVTTAYVAERFGVPAIARAFQWPSGWADDPRLRELVYRDRHAWLQTLVDENDAVVRFSITATDPRLRFQIRELTFGHMRARLGHTHFADVRTHATPDGRSLSIGAHNHEYAESYWFGYPGQYQRYVLSKNDVGVGEFNQIALTEAGILWMQDGELKVEDRPPVNHEFEPDAPYAQRFRAGTTVNTLTILGPPVRPPAWLAEPRGPHSTFTRMRVHSSQERRQIKRQQRRINRQVARHLKRYAKTHRTDEQL